MLVIMNKIAEGCSDLASFGVRQIVVEADAMLSSSSGTRMTWSFSWGLRIEGQLGILGTSWPAIGVEVLLLLLAKERAVGTGLACR